MFAQREANIYLGQWGFFSGQRSPFLQKHQQAGSALFGGGRKPPMQELTHALSCCKISGLRSLMSLVSASPEHLTPFKHPQLLTYSSQP